MKSSSDLKQELGEKEGTIVSLAREMDASIKLVEALKLKLEALEGKVEHAQSLEVLNASLMQELADVRAATESPVASTEQMIASFEDESSTEKALEETRSALDAVRAQHVQEAATLKKLDGELQTVTAKLADAEASRLKSASQKEEALAKLIRLLQSQISSLAMQLKEANDKVRKSEEMLKDHEAKVESMQGTLMQLPTNVLARANKLEASKEQASLAMAEHKKKNERLQSELDRVRKEMSNSLAEANVEITQRGLTARRGPAPEKGNIVEGYNVSGDKERFLPPKKTKYSSKAFINNGSGDKGITPDKNKGSGETCKSRNTVQSMVKFSKNFLKFRSTRSGEVGPKDTKGLSPHHRKFYNGMIFYLIIAVDLLIQVLTENCEIYDSTIRFYGVLLIATVCFDMGIGVYQKGKFENAFESFKISKKSSEVNDHIVNSVTGLLPAVATDMALAYGCGVFNCISMCDLTTETLLQCIRDKIHDGCIYLIVAVDLLIQVFAENRGVTDSTIQLYFALLIALACFNFGICIYHEGNVENANKIYKTMKKKCDTKDCVISGTRLLAEEAIGKALASNCDIFTCKSTLDLTTQTLRQVTWHKWFAFCNNMCLVNFHAAAYLTLNGWKKHVTALINTFIGWTGARMSTFFFETNECIANSFTAKFTAMRRTIILVLSSVSHLLVQRMTPVKVQRRKFFTRSSTIVMLAVLFTVSIIAGGQAQQVGLQFCFLLLSSSLYRHMHPHFLLQLSPG